MATTTSNFSWPIPQSTDLVKDGATAIASLGSGIDTSMVDLKGGTTGQILSKASGTDMDFTWINNDQGDITGVTAGTGLTGGGTSGSVTVSIDPDYYLLANQARRNAVINSNFSVWQRGTSFTSTNGSGLFAADRWQIYSGSTGRTFSRQVTNDTTNLPNIQYCVRVARDSGNTATNQINMAQNFETVNSIPFAGKTVTLSFYARAGANYSATSNALNVKIQTGTGTDQNGFYSGYTGSASPIDTNVTLTTTWQRFSVTGTIAATATELLTGFYFTPTGTAGANDYYEITGVQLELGSSANSYMPNQPTYQSELAACQRYYQRRYGKGNGTPFGAGQCYSTTAGIVSLPFPVTLRVTPSLASSGLYVTNSTFGSAGGTIAIYSQTSSDTYAAIATSASGLVAGNATLLVGTDANSYLELSAEL